MKLIYNNLIPFKGFIAINLFGVVFIRNEYKDKLSKIDLTDTIHHEAIHTAQMKEMLYIGFYIWYLIEWLIRLLINGKSAYYHLLHEKEAFENERDRYYLMHRKPYAWLKRNKKH